MLSISKVRLIQGTNYIANDFIIILFEYKGF